MNANEIMDGLEKEVLNRYGEGHSCSERNFLREAIRLIDENQKALSRSRIRDTATEPPTREDANGEGLILALCVDYFDDYDSRWNIKPFRYVTKETANVFPKWTQLPKEK